MTASANPFKINPIETATELRTPGQVAKKINEVLERLPIIAERRSRLSGLVDIFVSLDPSWSITPLLNDNNDRSVNKKCRDRPLYPQASDVAALVTHTYLQLTGEKAISFPEMESGNTSANRTELQSSHEPFLKLMAGIFDALQIAESPEHYAARAAECFKDNGN